MTQASPKTLCLASVIASLAMLASACTEAGQPQLPPTEDRWTSGEVWVGAELGHDVALDALLELWSQVGGLELYALTDEGSGVGVGLLGR
jgi:hypothetical protein